MESEKSATVDLDLEDDDEINRYPESLTPIPSSQQHHHKPKRNDEAAANSNSNPNPKTNHHHDLQLDKWKAEEEEEDVIIKELRNVKRQNRITHVLLTAMLVVTVTWQLSEVSLILKIKEGFRNPFKSLAGMLLNRILPKRRSSSSTPSLIHPPDPQHQSNTISNSLKMPDLSYLTGFDYDTSDDDDS